jgi:hypothetical protein
MQVMIDIETLAQYPGASIVSIGACKFYWKDGDTVIADTYYTNVCAISCKKIGLVVDPKTIDWWMKQSKEARDAWKKDPKEVKPALTEFNDWYGSKKNIPWVNGASFDYPILEVAYRKLGMSAPWEYYNQNDMRTIINVLNLRSAWKKTCETSTQGEYHNALADSIRQAKFLGSVLKDVLQ